MPIRIPNSFIPKLLKVARHEMGHFIVARYHGFVTGDCKIKLLFTGEVGHAASATIQLQRPIRSIEDVVSYAELRCQVLSAGALAEALDEDGGIDNAYAINETQNGGAKDDYSKVRELLHLIRNINHAAEPIDDITSHQQLNAVYDRIWNDAAKIVTDNHELISGLAYNLADRVKMTDTEYVLTNNEIEQVPNFRKWVAHTTPQIP